jgi:hypothetical protein
MDRVPILEGQARAVKKFESERADAIELPFTEKAEDRIFPTIPRASPVRREQRNSIIGELHHIK